MNIIYAGLRRIIKRLVPRQDLEDDGERVDIVYDRLIDFDVFNIYEKSHYRRYEYARKLLTRDSVCGDFACGTGYGSMMLAERARQVIGVDLNARVVKRISQRYSYQPKVKFQVGNLLNLQSTSLFDSIVSFETLEHFSEPNVLTLLNIFHKALKPKGMLIFSTPYLQQASPAALKMGFHKTFQIDEFTIKHWLQQSGFQLQEFKYQDYKSHSVVPAMEHPDFIIGCALRS